MGEAIIWDAMSGAKLRTMMCGGMVYSVDLSFDKHLLATGDQCKEAKVWNVSTGALVHTLTCDEVVKRVDLAGDSSLLATGTGESCKIWDVASGCLIHTQVRAREVVTREEMCWYVVQ
jgi:COMPASS component SWD3